MECYFAAIDVLNHHLNITVTEAIDSISIPAQRINKLQIKYAIFKKPYISNCENINNIGSDTNKI